MRCAKNLLHSTLEVFRMVPSSLATPARLLDRHIPRGPGLGCCAKYAESCQQLVCGRAMQQWWDISEAAGPKARASEPFSEGIPELECLTVVDNELKSLGRLIFDFLGDITYRIF